jgi:hypothetical protein
LAAATVAAVLAGCGGGTSPPTTPTTSTPAPTPTPPAGDQTKLAVLDSGNFDTLVLGTARPSLVEFQRPT